MFGHLMRAYLGLVGSVLLAAGAWLLFRRIALRLRSAVTQGVIITYETRRTEDGEVYLPVVSFQVEGGGAHQFTSVAGSDRRPTVGSSVAVRYNRVNPADALIDSFLHYWAAPLGLLVLGAAGVWAWFG